MSFSPRLLFVYVQLKGRFNCEGTGAKGARLHQRPPNKWTQEACAMVSATANLSQMFRIMNPGRFESSSFSNQGPKRCYGRVADINRANRANLPL